MGRIFSTISMTIFFSDLYIFGLLEPKMLTYKFYRFFFNLKHRYQCRSFEPNINLFKDKMEVLDLM